MRFSPALLDDIRARLPVSEVVARRVKLQKAGREWKGLSPFSAEKTPSFFVNDQKMAWFDFSSGRNGNIFDFVMATEGLSFPEAVEQLASQAGVPLPVASPENVAREKKRAGLHEVLEHAAAYFEATLHGRDGASARAYLAERGLAAAVQKEFRLGYALDQRHALRDHLAGKGASVETMIEAGLLVHGDDIPVPYDRFRGRVMFPIADRGGRIIAFGGRALAQDAGAKYLNSPETPLFHKGSVLYNHHRARTAAHDSGTVIAVEGYVDVIAMTLAGFPHTVAPLGTALTADQCELLWRMAPEPILCFDGDRAGRKAAARAVDLVLPLIGAQKTVRFAMLPEGQDPDDLVRSGNAAALAEVVAGARPLVDVLWAREVDAASLDTPERRAALEHRLAEILKGIADEPVRRHYRAEINERLSSLLARGGAPAGRGRNPAQRRRPDQRQAWSGGRGPAAPRVGYLSEASVASAGLLHSALVRRGGGVPTREASILQIVLNHPALLRRHAEELAALELGSPDLVRLRDALVVLAAEPIDDHRALHDAVDAAGLEPVRRKVESAAAAVPLWCMQPEAAETDAEVALSQALTLHRKMQALHRDLRSAERLMASEGSERALAQLRQIRAEMSAIEGIEAAVDGYGTLSGHASRDV